MKRKPPKRKYAGINHPAVAKVSCPYCLQPKGVPCRSRVNKFVPLSHYTQTHEARIFKALLESLVSVETPKPPKIYDEENSYNLI